METSRPKSKKKKIYFNQNLGMLLIHDLSQRYVKTWKIITSYFSF